VPAAEFAIETSVQMVSEAFAGRVASFLPVGTLASKVVNVEGKVVDAVGRANLKEEGRVVAEAEYREELDPEPTFNTAFALSSAWRGANSAAAIAKDKDRRAVAVGQAADLSKKVAAKSVEAGRAVGVGAVALAREGPQLAGKILDKAKGSVGDARSSPGSAS